ncbi:NUDIX domain-containing protein [Microbacterium sp. 179-B 1A2 NHS]|uniref:NUDIX hydrolase n=1 Tax=Microbacterium sp. 179-B 1A2 NHS TaxID=3142383 RepID=UPI0039A21CF0
MTTTDAATPGIRVIRVSAAVILDELGRLLLVRKAGTTAFMQPGGKPERGERPDETLSRELAEELGVRIDAATLRPLGVFEAAAANEPGFVVVADVFAADIGDQEPRPAAEIVELTWATHADASRLEIAPLAREHFLPA